jgi:hypothetical protein
MAVGPYFEFQYKFVDLYPRQEGGGGRREERRERREGKRASTEKIKLTNLVCARFRIPTVNSS